MRRPLLAPLGLAIVCGVLLGIATPPADVPGGAWLVLPAMMGWYAIATAGPRPLLQSYLLGCLHMAWFSWSLQHLLVPAYVAVIFVGGLYYLLATAATRAWAPRWRPLGFALACAASFWLRACMPEIWYPHGQPCHALYQWPSLLGAVTLGGEPLANASLAGIAAAAVGLCRSWRVASPAWGAAWRDAVVALSVAAVGALGGQLARGSVASAESPRFVDVVAIEPGFHPFELWRQPTLQKARQRYRELLRERFFEPTRALLQAESPPALVVWPESSVLGQPLDAFADLWFADLDAGRGVVQELRGLLPPAPQCRLAVGANALHPGTPGREPITTTALVLSPADGRVLGFQGKQFLVPGGEFLPLVGLLPKALAADLHRSFEQALGTGPDCIADRVRPPLELADGTRFGALICYDNAFPEPAAAQVAQGARFLAVLSNEAWYRGGAELEQLLAMTVVRALETATPIVRCTFDGASAMVDGGGRIVERLPLAPAPQPASRNLRVRVPIGDGGLPPMAWLRRGFGPAVALLAGLALAHGLVRWARLRSARTAPSDAPASGPPDRRAGGS
ncbi:MAG: apolipoprotein N-acyltransferase [Planctomycetes bacterium]|nr:apolipoprotein N-acyltransferase [Planctomycetota bacterium]